MADRTSIPWADTTWNPISGCTKTSPGCANCYIERTPPFRMAHRKFVNGTTGVQLHPERLDKPLHWRKPRRIFVCSLADLFHDDVPDDFIWEVMHTISHARQHVFQVLTKRPERMRDLLGNEPTGFTLKNLWLGVTIENARYTYRADILREIPAAVRFISAEPLLGSLYPKGVHDANDSRCYARPGGPDARGGIGRDEEGEGTLGGIGSGVREGEGRERQPLDLTGIDWVIAGCESGPKARPMDEDWVRELRDACVTARVADDERYRLGTNLVPAPAFFFKQQIVNGRKVECPELDGRQWMEFPANQGERREG